MFKNKTTYYGLALIAVAIVLSLILMNKDTKTTPTFSAKSNKTDDIEVSEDKTPSLFSKLFNKKEEPKIEAFQRKIPTYYFNKNELSKMIRIGLRDERLKKYLKEYKSNNSSGKNYNFSEKAVWNVNQAPENNQQYQLFIQEAEVKVLYELSEAVQSEDLKKIKLTLGALQGITMMSAFELKHVNENGEYIIKIKGDYFARKAKKNKREIASGHNSLFAMAPNTEPFANNVQQALAFLKHTQTHYNKPLDAEEFRRKVHNLGDPNANDAADAIEEIANTTTNVTSLSSTTNQFHEDNLDIISSTRDDIANNPSLYGFTAEEAKKLSDGFIPDIPLEIFMRNIALERALWAGLFGAGLSSTVSGVLSEMINKTRMYGVAVLTSIGIETVIMAICSYQGLKQIYMFHRYYSFLLGRMDRFGKKYKEQYGMVGFDSENIAYEKEFRSILIKSWLIGFTLGAAVKTQLHQKKLSTYMLYTLRQASQAPSRLKNSSFVTTLLAPLTKSLEGVYRSRSWHNYLGTLFYSKSLKAFHIGKQISRLGKKFSLMPKRAKALLIAADFGITGVVIYNIVKWNLTFSSQSILKTYLSPGTNIKLALSDDSGYNSEFHYATREIMYPLCIYLAQNSKFTYGTRNNFAPTKKRLQACKKIIMALEGWQNDYQIKDLDENLYNQLMAEKKQSFSEEEYDYLVRRAFEYPNEYRVTWLAGLRSIYSLYQVPEIFWRTRLKLAVGPNLDIVPSFSRAGLWNQAKKLGNHTIKSLSKTADTSANLINTSRLIYAIRLLSLQTYIRKIESKDEIENKEKITERKSRAQIITEQIPDLTEAYISYFKYHRQIVYDNMNKYLQIKDKISDNEKMPWIQRITSKSTTHRNANYFAVDDMDTLVSQNYLANICSEISDMSPNTARVRKRNSRGIKVKPHHYRCLNRDLLVESTITN